MTADITMKKILFATDLFENSRLALDHAVAFAEHFQAMIVMVHAVQLPPAAHEAEAEVHRPSVSRLSAEQRLSVLANGVRRLGISVQDEVVDGSTCQVVLEAAERHGADLIVLGVHGIHRGLEHLLIGSNTEKILLSARCPVLTVGPRVLTGFDVKLHLREILLFSDFTPEAASAAPYAIFLANEFSVPIEVCQLIPEIAENNERLRNEVAEEYCNSMKAVLGSDLSEWCKPAYQLERGMELEQLTARAETQDAGLIVLGVHAESQLGRHLHTSLAYQVLGRATCPVLTKRSA